MDRNASAVILALVLAASPALAAERVTVDNFPRAETHMYMKERVDKGCFAKLCTERRPAPVEGQAVIRMSRDTPYSMGVFDLTSPVTITMPQAGRRFQSLMVVNEDHYIKHMSYSGGPVTLTRGNVGTRYAYVIIRTFIDPDSEADQRAGWALQDAIRISQASPGAFEIPDWNVDQRNQLRAALLAVAPFVPDFRGAFGNEGETQPVPRLVGTAGGWGGNAPSDAIYLNGQVPNNDGNTAYTLTLRDVPVDGFWSVTVYNARGFYEAPENAISTNGVTAKPNPDGTTTIRFGGDPNAPNHLRIMPGWNYTVRLYRPRAEVLTGAWTFPDPVPAR